MSSTTQIYSATYSNVPVFEFVTPEGPIMRRKSDAWINATHILKIAKFPKAKRTRILEKDVQTGVHEKVQGGYGKFQGTYVPLALGREIAAQFGVLEILRPIFDFEYVEGKSVTPPPAPKHNHASALNVANKKRSAAKNDEPKKRGRPSKPNGNQIIPPAHPVLQRQDTAPILPVPTLHGRQHPPSFGSFEVSSFASRQDTDADFHRLTRDDLEEVDDDLNGNNVPNSQTAQPVAGSPRNSFVKAVHASSTAIKTPSISPPISDEVFLRYHEDLVSFFANDGKLDVEGGELVVPAVIANPPQPIGKVPINAAVDTEGNTIFHWVSSMGSLAELKFLIKTFPHLDITAKNNDGETALMFLVKYNNAFQLKTFPQLLELLENTWYTTDNQNKTVLHHIVQVGCQESRSNRERIARYYLEEVVAKLSELPPFGSFINHQDNDANTALHIAACFLKKKLIKAFLSHHQIIDFKLKNHMDYTVENYLAAHNHVLRLDNAILETDEVASAMDAKSFDSQLYFSKMAMNLHNQTANTITENLTELAYTIDKELSNKDDEILEYIKRLQSRRQVMLSSQLKIFKLLGMDELVATANKIMATSAVDDGVVEFKNERLLQEEVIRVQNDLCYQLLHQVEEFKQKMAEYQHSLEVVHWNKISSAVDDGSAGGDEMKLAIELTQEIIKRQQLASELAEKHVEVPMFGDSNKENFRDDKLQKYCKLISLACDMSVADVKSSIDLIEQSLMKKQ